MTDAFRTRSPAQDQSEAAELALWLALRQLMLAISPEIRVFFTQVAEFAQVQQWEQQAAGHRIFAPAGLPLIMRDQLLADDRLQPDRFSGIDNAFSPGAEQIKREEMQQAKFVLARMGDLLPPTVDERRRVRLLRFWYRYKLVRPAYLPLRALRAELLARAVPVGQADPYSGLQLYRLR